MFVQQLNVPKDLVIYSALVSVCAKVGDWDLASEVCLTLRGPIDWAGPLQSICVTVRVLADDVCVSPTSPIHHELLARFSGLQD